MAEFPNERYANTVANLPKLTGRPLEEWIEVVRSSGLQKHKEKVDWLKQNHGLRHEQALVVAWESEKSADYVAPTADDVLDKQYEGPKAALRPIYEALAGAARSLGGDVSLKTCQTYVALVRGKQFGVVQPSTKTRVDLGLTLPGVEPAGRLQAAKNVGSGRTTHQVALSAPAEVDPEVLGWLKAAYEAAK